MAPLLPGFCGGLRLASRSISIRGRIGVLISRAAGARAVDEAGAPFPDDLDTPARALAVGAEDEVLTHLVDAVRSVL